MCHGVAFPVGKASWEGFAREWSTLEPMREILARGVLVVVCCAAAACSSPQRSGPGGPPPAGASANGELPADVRATLDQYLRVLRQSRTIDECAASFVGLAGGGLVDESGQKLRTDVPQFSLKKDHDNVKFYADPPQVTRVDVDPDATQGYGASALRGRVYKIWVAKAQGQPGMPAPISILVPTSHPTIKSPKVVGIGSL